MDNQPLVTSVTPMIEEMLSGIFAQLPTGRTQATFIFTPAQIRSESSWYVKLWDMGTTHESVATNHDFVLALTKAWEALLKHRKDYKY